MKIRLVLVVLILATALSSCELLGARYCAPACASRVRQSTSLVGFLYPGGATPPTENSIPTLPVPLRVGLAFLPSPTSGYGVDGPGAADKELLLERIRQRFLSRKFIAEITIIPDYYLANGRGFVGLEGIQRLYDVDLVALVSYDQVTYSEELKYRSLAYLTIVGAFLVNGSEHEVTTLVDLAVVDPKTRSLVLRAGGVNRRSGVTNLVDREHDTRAASAGGFSGATDTMISNFDLALAGFEAEVRAGTARVSVVNRDGTARAGAGALDAAALLALALLLWLRQQSTTPRARAAP